MADDILQGVLLSRKETKTLKQLKEMGNVKVPVQRKDINYYLVALEELLQEEAVTFYLDVVTGDDSNSGLSRSMPMKTVAAVVALARSMAGGNYSVSKYRLTILGEGETISFNGVTHTNAVLFDATDFRSDPYIPESDDLLPFQVITSEDRGTSLIFANSLKITGDALFIGCKGSVTVANGSSLNNVSGNVYVKAKNLTLTNASKIGGGADTIVDVTGTLEMSNGGGISCGGDIVVNAKNIKILSGASISNGGSRYFRALKDITVESPSSTLGTASGITDIEAGNNILIRYSPTVSVGDTYPFNMRAGNDITIHSTGGLANSKGNNIVAGGTVRIANTIMPYGANITARNITDVIDENIKGGVIVGESLNKALRWEASDTIELYATLIANNDPSVGCYFKAYRMKLGGNYFRISGDVFLESYILQPHYITNSGVRQDYPFIANTNLTVKTAILTHNHEDYPNMAGQISILEVTEDSRKNRIQITADLITEDVQIAISGDFNAYIEANKIISTQLFNLNLQECVQNGCDRRVIDKSRLLPAYDAVIARRLDLEWNTGTNAMLAKDLKEALESPIIESIYLSEPVSLDEDVVLGHDKVLYGEAFSYSGVMTGAFTVKFFNHLAMNGGTFSCAAVYSRTSNGDLTIGGTCNFYYERRLSGTVTMGETASYSYNAWETETYAVADEETITGGAALGTDLKVLNAPVIRQPVLNNTGETIPKGTPVALTGTSGERVTISKLVSSATIREQVNVGVVDADILPDTEGYAVRSGEITMDTNLWTEGDILYASTTAGVLTNLRPPKGYGVIPVGMVIKKDGINAGKVLVNPFSVPSIRQLPDVDIVDPLPNQVLSINEDGLVKNRFITFIANYDGTDNDAINEEFEKGSVIVCHRGYSYAEYLPLIRRIAKTSHPDPETFIYVFGAVHDGNIVEVTCDPVDGWSVLETPVGGDYRLKGQWTTSESYVLNDVCIFGDNIYICKSDYTSDTESPDPSIDTDHWELFFEGASKYQLKGTWAVGVDYVMNDFCTFGDNLYICKSDYTSDSSSDNPSIDTTHWELLFDGTSKYQLKGTWSNSESYVMNDFCTFGGDLYICKSAYTSDPESDDPSIDTTHWEMFFEASLAQEIGYAASGDALGANASISLQAGSSTQWSAHGVLSSSTSKLTPEVGTSLLGCVVSQVVAGGHFIIAAYKLESGGAHSLICSTGVLDMPASAGWLNGTVDLISSTNKFVPPNELIYFVIMTDITGASVAGSGASGNLNIQPYASAIKTNMGVLTEAPATLTFEGETPLRPFVFLRK